MQRNENIPAIDYNSQSDENLAALCQNKDRQAFQELLKRYLSQVYNFVKQYAKNPDDVDDVVQDTFFKVWKNIRCYTQGRQFRPWLFTIGRNTALDYIKRKKSLPFSNFDDEENDLSFSENIRDPEPLPSKIFEDAEIAKKLNGALQDLHPDYRAVLTLHYNDELTFEEIAEIMGSPMNTVKSWHRRALIKLRNKLESENRQIAP